MMSVMFVDALWSEAPSRPAAAPVGPFSHVTVRTQADAVDGAWADLEQSTPCSIYQTRRFLQPWAETLGRKAGLQPCYALARDPTGRPDALLALGIGRRGPLRVAEFLGGRDANLQQPLLRDANAWNLAAIRSLLGTIARAANIDVFVFTKQPLLLGGHRNPLSTLGHSVSTSAAWETPLPFAPSELFSARLSKDARGKLRRKAVRLGAIGPLRHVVAHDATQRTAILDGLIAQKAARFRARGIASQIETPPMRAFLERAAANPEGLELHGLLAGERLVATYCGAAHGGRWSGMLNSFDADPTVARSSPGDLLLMHIVEDCCRRGLTTFDLGVGAARYKSTLCDTPIPLFDAAIGFGAYGRLAAGPLLLRHAAKRRIVRHPRLFALARRLRG